MLRRRRVLLGVLVALLLIGVGGWLTFGPDKIRPGMTRNEVETILGPPDGRMLAIDGRPIQDVVLVWKNRQIVIKFDEVNRVRDVERPPTFLENLRAKIGF